MKRDTSAVAAKLAPAMLQTLRRAGGIKLYAMLTENALRTFLRWTRAAEPHQHPPSRGHYVCACGIVSFVARSFGTSVATYVSFVTSQMIAAHGRPL